MRIRNRIAVATTLVAMASLGVCPGEIGAPGGILAPVTVTAQRNLSFGDVFPGVNKSIVVTDATSGKWYVTGDPGVAVDLTFLSLPATLSNGGSTIPIVYSATDAAHHTSDDPGSATSFDPSVGASPTLSGTGELYVWIGGTVQPSEVATAGTYSGTITLDAVYP